MGPGRTLVRAQPPDRQSYRMINRVGRPARDQLGPGTVCYTEPMFIHRISVTGLSDRGAWPWRSLPTASAFA